MSVIEHHPCEKPSDDSPGCKGYFIVQCDACGECWVVEPKSEELEFNGHLCAACTKAEVEYRQSEMLEHTRHLLAECQKATAWA